MLTSPPLWRTIAQSLEEKIRNRQLSPGDKLPTEHELSRQFMVNRHTVRRALSALQEKGIVESSQGRGSYVRRPSAPSRLRRRPRFSDAVRRAGNTPSTDTIKLEVRPANAEVANALDLKVGQPVIYLERRRLINGEPTALSQHHFSFERFPTFVKMYRERGSITATLTDSGVPDYTRRWVNISARLPTNREAELMRLPRHVPLLVQRYVNVDGLDRPLEYGASRTAGQLLVNFADLRAEDRPNGD